MNVTVPDVMRHVRNYFVVSRFHGSWHLTDGRLLEEAFRPGEWIAVPDGPVCGIWQVDEQGMLPGVPDAEWTGRIFLLAPPPDFLRLCADIADWADRHPAPGMDDAASWMEAFSSALLPYQRMFPEVSA